MRPAHEPPSQNRLRDELRRLPRSRFVDTAEFVRLLRSRLDLERSDAPRAQVCGLRDRRSGTTYLIEAERLRGRLDRARVPLRA
jgi:hypothetical protein